MIYIYTVGEIGLCLNSTSHIESIWSQSKAIIKKIYYVIPKKNLLYFIREGEWRLRNKNKTLAEKIDEFFQDYYLISDMADSDFLMDDYV